MTAGQNPDNPPTNGDILIANLNSPQVFGHSVSDLRLLETHISWIILTGEYVYKIKKPVDFGFLDFSTLEQRHFYCTEELRLNRRFTPEIYLGLAEIRGNVNQPCLHGEGEVIEYAIKMREFPQEDLLSARAAAGLLDAALIDAMATRISDVHASCEIAPGDSDYGRYSTTRRWSEENMTHLAETIPDELLPDGYHRLCEWYRQQEGLEAEIDRRKQAGFVRECHGDLHLGNMALVDGRVILFDCLEFNPELRWIDTISEAAFVAMDLQARGFPGYCWRFINRYLESGGDYGGIRLLRYYFVYRALVRAKVEALRAEQDDADLQAHAEYLQPAFDYIDLADRWAHDHRAGLILMHGLSGSGKSTVAAKLVEALGAIQVRSDVERKRLHGFSADAATESALGEGIYTADASETTYARLRDLAQTVIDADFCVIVDATCLRAVQRDTFLSLAAEQNCRAMIIDCDVPLSELERRIVARSGDASEANLEVLKRQVTNREAIGEEEKNRVPVVRIGADGLGAAEIAQVRDYLAS